MIWVVGLISLVHLFHGDFVIGSIRWLVVFNDLVRLFLPFGSIIGSTCWLVSPMMIYTVYIYIYMICWIDPLPAFVP